MIARYRVYGFIKHAVQMLSAPMSIYFVVTFALVSAGQSLGGQPEEGKTLFQWKQLSPI